MTGFKILTLERADWMKRGACRGAHINAFFPERGGATKEVKAICASCPVLTECREHVLDIPHHEKGIWGGLSERQRRAMRKQRAVEAKDAAA